jgi:hypothetical protein
MTWLVESKVLPPLKRGDPPGYQAMYSESLEEKTVGWDLTLNGKPLGWALNRVQWTDGLRTDKITTLKGLIHFEHIPLEELAPDWMKTLLRSADSTDNLEMDADSTLIIDALGHLTGFDSAVRFGQYRDVIKVSGRVQASLLKVNVEAGQFKDQFDTWLPSGALVTGELSTQSRMAGIYVGQEWTVPVFNPLRPRDNPVEILQARVEESDPLVWGERTVAVRKVVYRADSGSAMSSSQEPRSKLWVADDGSVLRQEISLFGSRLVFVLMSQELSADLAKKVERDAEEKRLYRGWRR